MSAFTILLDNLQIVRTPHVVEEVVRIAYGPIAQSANRSLVLTRSGEADVALYFDPGGEASAACGLLILGDEGGGNIWVGACRDLRVCGDNPRSRTDYVFEPNEVAFGRCVGNVAVHELGHIIATLPHHTNPNNFMHTGSHIPRGQRTRDNMRGHWAGRKSFNREQIASLAAAIRANVFTGGVQIE
jgi:hypothetical protein